MAYDTKTGQMKPNTTAPAKARSKTAGPNKSFPVGDKTHERLAEQMAPRSYNAGHISKGQEQTIIRKAKAALGEASAAPKPSTKPAAPKTRGTMPRKGSR